MAPARSPASVVLAALTALVLVLAAAGVLRQAGSERAVTHVVGVFVTLSQLLREGTFYPHSPTPDLVYATFYQPLSFAPLALLPGKGLEQVPALRVLVGAELLLCLVLLATTLRTIGLRGALAWQPALWALCASAVSFSWIGMRDDPRGTLLALVALWLGVRGGTHWTWLAPLLLTLAFLVKLTAPLAAGAALLFLAWQRERRDVLRFALTILFLVAASYAFFHLVLGADLLGNGLRWTLLEQPRAPRSLPATFGTLAQDLARDPVTPLLLLPATLLSLRSLLRRRADWLDVLLLAALVKTLLVYRSEGSDLNHFLDLDLFAAARLGKSAAAWLDARRALEVLALLAAVQIASDLVPLGTSLRRVLWPPASELVPLADSRVARTVAALRSQPPARTLCEDPLIALELGSKPLVVDPLLGLAGLRAEPALRAKWFDPQDPLALQRIVLLHDPFAPGSWYPRVSYDQEFVDELRARWHVAATSGDATVLVRK
jgi:hypothetical protein